MESTTTAVPKSQRKRGMTLEQLVGIVQKAMADDVPMDARVRATVGFRGQVQTVTLAEPVATDG